MLDIISRARSDGARTAFDPDIRPALWSDNTEIRNWIEHASAHVDIALPMFDDDAANFGDEDPATTAKRYQQMGVEEVAAKMVLNPR